MTYERSSNGETEEREDERIAGGKNETDSPTDRENGTDSPNGPTEQSKRISSKDEDAVEEAIMKVAWEEKSRKFFLKEKKTRGTDFIRGSKSYINRGENIYSQPLNELSKNFAVAQV